ncbi:MAG: NUDIX domain-containing protein [Novosphingobium sp.]|nr:NUDIX domain-containing protein [Novosphingobium sp.]
MKINRLLSRVLVSGLMIFNSLNLLTMHNPHNNHHNNHYRYDEASVVIWTSWDNNYTKWVLLARESYGNNDVRGTWDCFGGGRNKGENHPAITAGRELHEETAGALLTKDFLINKLKPESFIRDTIGKRQTKTATYIVKFHNHALTNLTKNFYDALQNPNLTREYKEKDCLAWVRYDVLKNAIDNAINNNSVFVKGNIVNWRDTSRNAQIKNQSLKLRPFFVRKLKNRL